MSACLVYFVSFGVVDWLSSLCWSSISYCSSFFFFFFLVRRIDWEFFHSCQEMHQSLLQSVPKWGFIHLPDSLLHASHLNNTLNPIRPQKTVGLRGMQFTCTPCEFVLSFLLFWKEFDCITICLFISSLANIVMKSSHFSSLCFRLQFWEKVMKRNCDHSLIFTFLLSFCMSKKQCHRMQYLEKQSVFPVTPNTLKSFCSILKTVVASLEIDLCFSI